MTTRTNRWLERPAAARRVMPGALWPAMVLTGAAFLAMTTVQAAETPPQERAALEKQLQDAQSRLDDAARDVADLTSKLYGGEPGSVDVLKRRHGAPPSSRGAMLGINIGGEQTRVEGVEVMSVSPSGPAEKAGLRKGDVVTSIDGKPLRKTGERGASRQIVEHLRGVEPGQVVKLDYLRDGKKMSASVTTVAAEPPMMRVVREHLPMLEGMQLPIDLEGFMGGHGRGFRSLELVPITPKLGQYFGTDKGLLVVRAPAAAASKLEEGDVILAIGGRTPESPRHAFRILGSYQPSEQVKVDVLRQRKRMTVEMQVPEAGDAPELRQGPPPPSAPVPPVAPRTGSVSS